jgi:hypothetical protein
LVIASLLVERRSSLVAAARHPLIAARCLDASSVRFASPASEIRGSLHAATLHQRRFDSRYIRRPKIAASPRLFDSQREQKSGNPDARDLTARRYAAAPRTPTMFFLLDSLQMLGAQGSGTLLDAR